MQRFGTHLTLAERGTGPLIRMIWAPPVPEQR